MRQSGGPNCLLIGTSFTLLAGTRCEKEASSPVNDDVERCSSLFWYLWINQLAWEPAVAAPAVTTYSALVPIESHTTRTGKHSNRRRHWSLCIGESAGRHPHSHLSPKLV